MTDNTNKPVANEVAGKPTQPKKTSKTRITVFGVIFLIFSALGIDHYTTKWISGGIEITVTDSTVVATPIIDTVNKSIKPHTSMDTTNNK